jgi:nickel/cobalt transporter (NiCoT) family protein
MVLLMAVLVVAGAHAISSLLDADSPTKHALGVAGTVASGGVFG